MSVQGVVRELLTILGFDVNETGFKRAEGAFKSLIGLSAELVSRLDRVGEYFFNLTMEVAKTGEQAYLTGQILGISAEQVQELGYAADQAGVPFEAIQMGMRQITARASEALHGNKALAGAFHELGVQVKGSDGKLRPSIDLFEAAITKIGAMTNASQKLAAARKLFARGGERLIPLINEGPDALKKYAAELRETGGFLTNAQAQAGDNLGDHLLKKVTAQVRGLKYALAEELQPTVEALIESFSKWMVANRGLLNEGLRDLVTVLKAATKTGVWFATNVLVPMAKAFVAVTTAIIDNIRWIKVTMALTAALGTILAVMLIPKLIILASILYMAAGALAAAYAETVSLILGWVTLAATVAGVVAALALVALVIEDIYTYLTGGESLIGEFFDEFLNKPIDPKSHWMVKAIAFILWTIRGAIDLVGELFTFFFELPGKILDALSGAFDSVVDSWKKAVRGFVAWLSETMHVNIPMPFEERTRDDAGRPLSPQGLPLGSGPRSTAWPGRYALNDLSYVPFKMAASLPSNAPLVSPSYRGSGEDPAHVQIGDTHLTIQATTKEGVTAEDIATHANAGIQAALSDQAQKAQIQLGGRMRGVK